ncbi:MAG: endopeptidase La [Desulfobulbaceae bacterium]|nr:endopeptidase La [Desulfobulbaceae bacterium]
MGFFDKWQGPAQESEQQEGSETDRLRNDVLKAKMPFRVQEVAIKEIEKLVKTNPSATEYTIGINYIEYLISLPWNETTGDNMDIVHAKKILDEEHYGLEDIKRRILEYLAVRIMKLSGKQKVLVVDDEETACRNIEHILTKDGYAVSTATSGVAALNLLERHSFDIVVTDLKMESVDGMEVLEKAKGRDPSVEVIMVSGHATPPVADEALQKGSFHFLAKPFKLDELRTTIRDALKEKRAHFGVKSPALCFVGPPGTGKTSLQRCIARSLGRKFIRISLAGMKDEAQIRGHRRSYVGALPGRIIQEIRRAGSKNPVVMLDEIDKIGQDFKGDPASALLEVLDPSQNTYFIDHYLDVPFDLSNVMFIATANTLGPIPAPLLDRLEVITLSGYTEEEKEEIAFRFLIPREIEDAGLSLHPPVFNQQAVLKIIREHTRESGLRNLRRQIASICRKIALEQLNTPHKNLRVEITPNQVDSLLGPSRYFFEQAEEKETIGMATGLALTESGGQIIFIEATIMKGKEDLILTGSLGEVMKESAQAALSYVRSHATFLGIPEDFFAGHDIHIHIPAGGVPKDGPSAGLPMAICLISLLTKRPVRREVALTGELTLSGRILPVGGVKEKILAARRAQIKTVILPSRNQGSLQEIAESITKDLQIVTSDEIDKIIGLALSDLS